MSKRRNLRDEEARVIGVQDNAAQEMRRVKARRPHDAAERRDKKSQESRVGSRERNARDEMRRLRGEAVGMGMKTGGKTPKPSTQRQSNMLIPQHKRMAMGQNVLLAKGGRAPSTTAVNIDMGAPKTKTIKARGMGAATRGGNFRENT
jgi:hypothetical protein